LGGAIAQSLQQSSTAKRKTIAQLFLQVTADRILNLRRFCMLTPMIKSVELPDRIALSYVEQGDRSGIPVLLLHGVTDSWYSYQPVLPHLPASMHVFALTQRGHGDSSHPVSGYRFDDFASDLAAFMDALEIESAVIVGHSMGSSVAQRFAIDYPNRTAGLVLVGSFVNFRANPDVRALWDSAISTLTDPVDPDSVDRKVF
jgi:non-heme chloroperoxidase